MDRLSHLPYFTNPRCMKIRIPVSAPQRITTHEVHDLTDMSKTAIVPLQLC